eukprot:GHVS01010166.1.p1 GENE.GHVS01010166.1~~GHVS01010166.1.p1  ORF type:complete len:340 (+),score=43.09 GHVS01010166.1:35-1054(+)
MEEELQGSLLPREVTVTYRTPEMVRFTLQGVNTSVANGLRRVMIAEVPTLAIDLVSIEENTSCLHDEFLALRLGLLPIDSRKADQFKYREECECSDRCRFCSVEYDLNVCCEGDGALTVTHLDVQLDDQADSDAPMPAPTAEDLRETGGEGVVIAKLRKNQCIRAKVIAVKGTGKMHAKWIPVCTAVYKYEPKIELAERLLLTVPPEHKQEIVRSCPRKVFAYEDDTDVGGNGILRVANPQDCIFCDECVLRARHLKYRDLVKVKHREGIFHFTIESSGCMPAELIVERAFQQLLLKLSSLAEELARAAVKSAAPLSGAMEYEETGDEAAGGAPGFDLD